jgi:aspartate racemase
MKTIGLIGGMSWESTALYYRQINLAVQQRLGGLHSAKLVLLSVDFHEIESLQRAGNWAAAADVLANAARSLEAAGADFLLLGTNTMHIVAPAIEAAVRIPLLHIADPTAQAIQQAGYTRIGLLGTRFTMEQSFYTDRLRQQGLQVLLPEPDDRDTVHRIIFEELCLGQTLEVSRQHYRRIMAKLVAQGAQGIILGCTEITLLVGATDASVPLFDTTAIHASAAVTGALA